MPITTTQSLQNSLPTIIMEARQVREAVGIMPTIVDKKHLPKNSGLGWTEAEFAQLIAQAVTETTVNENYQELSDSLLTIIPQVVEIVTLITDRVFTRLSKAALLEMGSLAQNAIQRAKDESGLVFLDGATISLGNAGTTITSGHCSAAVSRIKSNVTEMAPDPIHIVLHGFQLRYLYNEMVSGVGTNPIPEGPTANVYSEGWRGRIASANTHEDGNLAVDSSDDAKGGAFATKGIVLVEGDVVKMEVERKAGYGGGANAVYQRDEYEYGERSAGNWMYELYFDATAPTS